MASLSQTVYATGDTIVIALEQALTQIDIRFDTASVKPIQPDSLLLKVPITVSKVGVYQLVINGMTTQQLPVSDTVAVEIRSDTKPQPLSYQVVTTLPHQSTSFTQGLEFYKGSLYESTGLNGQSRLMRIDVSTGASLQSTSLPPQYFGEGITIVGDRIYQLTWTSGQCFRYTLGFEHDQTFSYPTQGWGMTHQDTTLIVSDGTNRLFFYTPNFQPIGFLYVYDDHGAVAKLNELEYVNGFVLANVWETNRIVQIDLESGKVVGELNLEKIVPKNLADPQANVLNGIAYHPKEKALYVTGKNWPALFKLQVNNLLQPKGKKPLAL
ncbi:glutaminyl-peptide cyclotransferase [Larkinella harenae]